MRTRSNHVPCVKLFVMVFPIRTLLETVFGFTYLIVLNIYLLIYHLLFKIT
jgi:hypothetical protein